MLASQQTNRVPLPCPHEQVQLCDIVSGGFTHSLAGHRAAVWAVAWSPSNEWQLATGGCDGQLRLWDIRRAGPLHIFDQHDTQEPRAAGGRAAGQQQPQQQDGEAEGEGAIDQDVWGADAPQPLPPRDQDDQQPAPMQQAVAEAMQRQRSSGSGGARRAGRAPAGRAAAAADGSTAGSERMFLPERVTKYSTAHAGSITGSLQGLPESCAAALWARAAVCSSRSHICCASSELWQPSSPASLHPSTPTLVNSLAGDSLLPAGVVPTPDGLHWLSAGTDDRVRLWDAATYKCAACWGVAGAGACVPVGRWLACMQHGRE